MRVARHRIAWLTIAACACGDPTVTPVDAGRLDIPIPPPVVVDPVAAAMPPVFTPCPSGWSEMTRPDGTVVCDPYSGGEPLDCKAGSVQLPGEPSCRRFGSACPLDGVPTDLPSGAPVVYVRAGSTFGDGTLGSPFGTVSEGVAAAPLGAVVAIAPGTYDENIVLARPVTLFGACPDEVLLTSSVPDSPVRGGVVTIEGAGTAIQNLTIGQSERPGIWAVVEGAEVDVTDVVIAGADRVGIEVEHEARLSARGLIVRDTTGGATGEFGRGVGVQTAAVVEIRGALFERNREGHAVSRTGGSLLFEDALLRDALPRESSDRDGLGVQASAGGAARVVRSLVLRNRNVGIHAHESGSRMELEDVVVRDTQPQMLDGLGGRGLNAQSGATLTGRRVFVDQSREIGVFVSEPDTVVTLEDSIIASTERRATDAHGGRGITVQLGAVASLTRVEIDDSYEAGIMVGSGGATLSFADLVIRRSHPGYDGIGRGLALQEATSAVGQRLRIEDSDGVGFGAMSEGATFTLEDVRIVRTHELPGLVEARAIGVQEGARGTITRLELEDNMQYGVMATQPGTLIGLSQARVVATMRRDCDTLCLPGGSGVGAYLGAALVATTFHVETAETCGVHIIDGEMDLHEGEVSSCSIGACVQADGFDVSRLSADVRYHDNIQNLDTTMLPVPGTVPSVGTD